VKLTRADEDKYLLVLAITHDVVAGLVFLVGCVPILHLTVGIGLLVGDFPPDAHGQAPPEALIGMMGGFFVAIAGTIIVLAWSLSASMIVVARSLQTKRRHTFCLVVAFVESMFAPVGTALGLLTIILLLQSSVRARFEGEAADPPPADRPPA
jgi:hypothetical protein